MIFTTIPDMIVQFVAVNAVATILLAAMAYVGSALALDWLESLDRGLSRRDASPPTGSTPTPTAGSSASAEKPSARA